MKKLTTIIVFLSATFLITSFSLSTETPVHQAGEIHYAKVVHYHQFGRLQTDTLCLNDSLWIRDNEHKKIPAFMEDKLWSFRSEPSLVKISTTFNKEDHERVEK